jgi:hypothetical protein
VKTFINDNDIDSQNLSLDMIALQSDVMYMINHQEGFSYAEEYVPEQLTMIALPQSATRGEMLSALYHFMVSTGYQFDCDEYIDIVRHGDNKL